MRNQESPSRIVKVDEKEPGSSCRHSVGQPSACVTSSSCSTDANEQIDAGLAEALGVIHIFRRSRTAQAAEAATIKSIPAANSGTGSARNRITSAPSGSSSIWASIRASLSGCQALLRSPRVGSSASQNTLRTSVFDTCSPIQWKNESTGSRATGECVPKQSLGTRPCQSALRVAPVGIPIPLRSAMAQAHSFPILSRPCLSAHRSRRSR